MTFSARSSFRRRSTHACWIAALLLCVARAGTAAELERRTNAAFDAYLQQARRAFVGRDRSGVTLPEADVVSAHPAREEGIIGAPGGLIHHWSGSVFARGLTLRSALDVSTGFPAYSSVYKRVISARVIAKDGDDYHVLMRVQEAEGGISAVLDIRSTVEYRYPTSRSALVVSTADEIREVKNAGRPDEYLLAAGRDSGYLWRAATFTYFREDATGLYIETETLGLSRGFPPLLGWIIEPIARRVGRRSVATTLQELVAAARTKR
jgi:hypothetical protein